MQTRILINTMACFRLSSWRTGMRHEVECWPSIDSDCAFEIELAIMSLAVSSADTPYRSTCLSSGRLP